MLNPSALPDDPQPEDKTGVAVIKPKPKAKPQPKPTPKPEAQSIVKAQIEREGAVYVTVPKQKLNKGGKTTSAWRNTETRKLPKY